MCAQAQRSMRAAGAPQRRGLIVHAPAAIGELELRVLDQCGGDRALGVARLLPPAREEGRLDVDEPAVRVGCQVLHDRVDGKKNLLLEVLVDGHLPPGIVVAVRHEVHVDFALDGTAARVVLAVLGEGVRWRAARLHGFVLVELNGWDFVVQLPMGRDGNLLLGKVGKHVAIQVVGTVGAHVRRQQGKQLEAAGHC